MTRKRRVLPKSIHFGDAGAPRLHALREQSPLDVPSLFDERGLDKLLDAVLGGYPDPDADPNEAVSDD